MIKVDEQGNATLPTVDDNELIERVTEAVRLAEAKGLLGAVDMLSGLALAVSVSPELADVIRVIAEPRA